MFHNVLMIFLGLFLLSLGAEALVRGNSNIAKRLHIPEILIGLTIVSIGTSLPELIVSIKSSLQNSTDLILGNALGSNLCNLLFVLGVMALIKPIDIQGETKYFYIPLLLASTMLILEMTFTVGGINFGYGIILIILFLVYLMYPILSKRKEILEAYHTEKRSDSNQTNILFQLLLIIIGIVLLKIGGDFVVDYATVIAESYGISERIIGLTIVALGTSLPELITSVIATIKGNTDIAIGNLLGSSIFNLFLTLGAASLITPIIVSKELLNYLILLVSSVGLIWAFCYIPEKNKITRFKGSILIFIFVIYALNLFI